MTHTPDEIKRNIITCMELNMEKFMPGTTQKSLADALAYIQQLEAERDAAVALIPRACAYCKWYGTKHGGFHPDCKNQNGCRNVSGINTGWQWRGV